MTKKRKAVEHYQREAEIAKAAAFDDFAERYAAEAERDEFRELAKMRGEFLERVQEITESFDKRLGTPWPQLHRLTALVDEWRRKEKEHICRRT